MTDIVDRLREACVGHPAAKIPWPHRLLHDAIAEIERLRAVVDELCREPEQPRYLAKGRPAPSEDAR